MRHAIGALIFVIILTVVGIFVLNTDTLLPTQASEQAIWIDELFGIQFKAIAFLFALIIGVMVYSLIFFRRKPGDMEDGAYIKENSKLEIAWTVIPLLTVIGLSMLGSNTLAKTMRMDPQALEVEVTGQQWSWSFEYPEYGIVSTELVLPVDQQVLLSLTSVDVIHSFWVPEFRVKQDALPGTVRELRVTPTLIGEYSLMCAEICGQRHAYMNATVRVISLEAFQAWVNDQLASISADPVDRGKAWFNQFGCSACHTLDGTRLVGPSLLGLYGTEETFEDGSTTIVDEAYLYESITNPAFRIVQSYPNGMPGNFLERMTEEQIQDVIAFIMSVR